MLDIALLVAMFALALIPRLILNSRGSTDESVALWMIRRQQGGAWISTDVKDSIIEGYNGYPVFYHFLLSKFPRNSWVFLGGAVNIISDFIISAIVFFLTLLLCNRMGIQHGSGFTIPILAAITYLTFPVLTLPNLARVRGLSARAIGGIFVAGYGMSIGYGILYDPLVGMIIAIPIFLLCILVSQFALQVALFFSIFVALLETSWLPLLVILLGFIVGLLFKPLKIRDLIRHNLNHKYWYFKNFRNRTTAYNRNTFKDFRAFPKALIRRTPVLKRLMLRDLTPIIGLYAAPALLVLFFLFFVGDTTFLKIYDEPMGHLLTSWTLASFIVFILVSFRPLSFVGEAERYFEYSAPTVSVVIAVWAAANSTMNSYLVVGGLIAVHVLITAKLLNVTKQSKGSRDRINTISEFSRTLADRSENPRVATIPCKLCYKLSQDFSALNKQGKFLYYFISSRGILGFPYMESPPDQEVVSNHFEVLPYSPSKLKELYGINYMIVELKFQKYFEDLWGEEIALLENPVHVKDGVLLIEL